MTIKFFTGWLVGLLILTGVVNHWLNKPEEATEGSNPCVTTKCEEDLEWIVNYYEQKLEKELAEFNKPRKFNIPTTNGGLLECVQKGFSTSCENKSTTTVGLVEFELGFATTSLPVSPEFQLYFESMQAQEKIRNRHLAAGQCPFNVFCPEANYDEVIAEIRNSLTIQHDK